MLAFLSGLLAGSIHVLSGPDHLAALLPLCAREPKRARALGATWGIGHGGGILFWCLLSAVGRSLFASSVISDLAELLVGFSLIALGMTTLLAKPRPAVHTQHGHGAALGMGVLHGTAGAGHLLGVMPTLGLPVYGVFAYALGYFAAGLFVMASFGAGVGMFVGLLGADNQRTQQLRSACSWLAMLVGAAWVLYSGGSR